jgi:hypothetical protein
MNKDIPRPITIYPFLNCFVLSRYFPTIKEPAIPATQ